jgi:hypothetical protein
MKRILQPAAFVILAMLLGPRSAIAGELIAPKRPDVLLVYPGATHVSYTYVGPLPELGYHVAERYPADTVIKWISSKLEEKRWRPLKRDVTDPAQPSSQVIGWSHFMDPRFRGQRYVYSWAGHWMDTEGNVVSYILQYHSANEGIPQSDDLNILAVYSTAEVVKMRQEWYAKLKNRYNQPK